MLSRPCPAKPRRRSKPRSRSRQRYDLFRSPRFSRHRPQQQITILAVIKRLPTISAIKNQQLTMLEMANQPLTVLGMVTGLLLMVGMGKIPTTIAAVMRTLCAVIGMNGMTAIGGNSTMSLSCWSEVDTIITTQDIGIRRGDTI